MYVKIQHVAMLISQDYFDEICIENYELLFDDDGDDDENNDGEEEDAVVGNSNSSTIDDKNDNETSNHVAHGGADKTSDGTSINQRKKELAAVQETIEQLLKQQQQNHSTNNTTNEHNNNLIVVEQTLLFSHLTTTYPTSRLGTKIRSNRNIFYKNLQEIAQALQQEPPLLSTILSSTTTIALEYIYKSIQDKNDFIYRAMFWKYDGFSIYWSFLERLTTTMHHECNNLSRTGMSTSYHTGSSTKNNNDYSNNSTNIDEHMRRSDGIISLILSTLCTLLTTTTINSTLENNTSSDEILHQRNSCKTTNGDSTDNKISQYSSCSKINYVLLRNEFIYTYQKVTSTENICSTWLMLYDAISQRQQINKKTVLTTISSQSSSLVLLLQQLLQLGYMSCQKCEENKRIWMMTTKQVVMEATSNSVSSTTITPATTILSLPSILTTSLINLINELNCNDCTTTNSSNSIMGADETGKEMEEKFDQNQNDPDDWIYDICTRICRFITVLCTFEYATIASSLVNNTSSSNAPSGTSTASSSVVVQSSHKHTIQFQEALAIPTLYRLVTILLPKLLFKIKVINNKKLMNVEAPNNVQQMQQQQKKHIQDTIGSTISVAIGTVRSLAIQDEIIKEIDTNGFVHTLYDVLVYCFQQNVANHDQENEESGEICDKDTTLSIVTSVVGLLRNLAMNDLMKHKLLSFTNNKNGSNGSTGSISSSSNHTMPWYVRDIMIRYNKNPKHTPQFQQLCAVVQEHCIGWIAGMSLRCQPHVAELFINQLQIHVHIMDAMIQYPTRASLHRQAALAIRNLASRCETHLKTIMITSSVHVVGTTTTMTIEQIFHTITIPYHPTCHDEVYSALRDLVGTIPPSFHIEQDIQTGQILSIQKNRLMFGEGCNVNFRPVYE